MSSLFQDLHNQLSSYPAKEPIQKQFKQQILDYAQNEDILSSQNFTPGHITISALILSPDRNNVALIFHPFLKLWLQPGGHLELTDKTLLDGAKREANEEISISLLESILPHVFDLDIHTIPENPSKKQPSHLHLDFRFLFQAKNWDIKAASEIKEAKWVPLSEISQIKTDASVRRLIAKL